MSVVGVFIFAVLSKLVAGTREIYRGQSVKTTCLQYLTVAVLLFTVTSCNVAIADNFGNGDDEFEIEFVTIGAPSNIGDVDFFNGTGSLDYVFRIGKFEISREMVEQANSAAALGITLDTMSDIAGGPRDSMPATGISWFEAARFVNWLNVSSGFSPAYKFIGSKFELWTPADLGFDPNNLYRNTLAKYYLPSLDEWHKAAFHDPASGTYSNSSFATVNFSEPIPVASGTVPNTAVFEQLGEQGPADVTLVGGSPIATTKFVETKCQTTCTSVHASTSAQ